MLTHAMAEIERWEEIYRENARYHQNNNEHELYEFNQLIADELRGVLYIITNQKYSNDEIMEVTHHLRDLDWPMLDTITDAIQLCVDPSTDTHFFPIKDIDFDNQ